MNKHIKGRIQCHVSPGGGEINKSAIHVDAPNEHFRDIL